MFPFPRPWRFAALSAIVPAICAMLACSPPPPPPEVQTTSSREPAYETHPLTIRLADLLPQAETSPSLVSISFDSIEEEQWLSQGWRRIANGRSWMGESGSVEVPITQPEPLTIDLALQPSRASHQLPQQSVRVLWNDYDLGTEPSLDSVGSVRLEVPAEAQRYGANRIRLYPGYWFSPQVLGLDGGMDNLSLSCSEITFERERRLIPAARPAAETDGADVLLPAESTAVFDVQLPFSPAIQMQAQFENLDALPGQGRAVVAITGASGWQHVLLDQSAEPGEPFVLDQALEGLDGQMVSFSFSFPFTPEADDVVSTASLPRVRWVAPKIRGESVAVAKQDFAEVRGAYNVLMVCFDALRADYTPMGGCEIIQADSMKALAAEGVTFRNALSATSWTRCSAASYLTGLRPAAHQVLTEQQGLGEDLLFLPQMLQEAGYRTASVINNAQVAPQFGFGRGFDEVHEIYKDKSRRNDPAAYARKVWDENIDPFLQDDPGKPFFIYLHEIDPHSPYRPPGPYDTMYGDPEWRRLDQSKIGRFLVMNRAMQLLEPQIENYRNLYRGEISYMDAYLKTLREILREKDIERDTLVIFFSDHGEEFMEHQGLRHGFTLYEEVIRVPLIFSLKGVLPQGVQAAAPVELIDLPPTILDLIDEPIPPAMQGRSLLPLLMTQAEPRMPRPAYATLGSTPLLDAITLGEWKLIRRTEEDSPFADFMLFNLKNDPGEGHNLWSREPVVGRALRLMLEQQDRRDEAARTAEPVWVRHEQLEPEIRRDLEALGYL